VELVPDPLLLRKSGEKHFNNTYKAKQVYFVIYVYCHLTCDAV
jgi:hypothetical protein